MSKKCWTCKDGRKIKIKDMSDSHLKNTIAMLERAHSSLIENAWAACSILQGEMASYYAEQEIDGLEEVNSTHPLYDDLVEEQNKRSAKVFEKE